MANKEYGDTGGLDNTAIAMQIAAHKLKTLQKRWGTLKGRALVIYAQSLKHGKPGDEKVIDYLAKQFNEFLNQIEKELNKGEPKRNRITL